MSISMYTCVRVHIYIDVHTYTYMYKNTYENFHSIMYYTQIMYFEKKGHILCEFMNTLKSILSDCSLEYEEC